MSHADSTAGAAPVCASGLDDESAQWLKALRDHGPPRDVALSGLHARLLRIARTELQRRRVSSRIAGVELDDLAHHAASDALLAIDAKLDRFRGESRFTTWAYRFVVFEVSNKLGRHFWRNSTASMDTEDSGRLPDRFGVLPADRAEWSEMFTALRRAVEEDMSVRQRRVFVAIVLNDVPLDALVCELDTNRNALYKTMFDARRKLRAALVADGHLDATT